MIERCQRCNSRDRVLECSHSTEPPNYAEKAVLLCISCWATAHILWLIQGGELHGTNDTDRLNKFLTEQETPQQ